MFYILNLYISEEDRHTFSSEFNMIGFRSLFFCRSCYIYSMKLKKITKISKHAQLFQFNRDKEWTRLTLCQLKLFFESFKIQEKINFYLLSVYKVIMSIFSSNSLKPFEVEKKQYFSIYRVYIVKNDRFKHIRNNTAVELTKYPRVLYESISLFAQLFDRVMIYVKKTNERYMNTHLAEVRIK